MLTEVSISVNFKLNNNVIPKEFVGYVIINGNEMSLIWDWKYFKRELMEAEIPNIDLSLEFIFLVWFWKQSNMPS